MRKTPNGNPVRHVSQLERCPTASGSLNFVGSKGQKWLFRALFQPKSRHNFFTKIPNNTHSSSTLPHEGRQKVHPASGAINDTREYLRSDAVTTNFPNFRIFSNCVSQIRLFEKFVVLSPLPLRKRQSRATPSEAKLTIRCESRLRPGLLEVIRTSNHSKCRMSQPKRWRLRRSTTTMNNLERVC